MENREAIKKRFLNDPLPVRLGNLASNLLRISFFSQAATENKQVLNDVLEESKFFIEWVAPETNVELAGWLAQVQIKLCLWQLNRQRQKHPHQLRRISTLTKLWSSELLRKAGFLK